MASTQNFNRRGQDPKKATTNLKKPLNTSVNSQLRESLSPSPEPLPSSTNMMAQVARSPYRDPGYSARGEKRRREDEYNLERAGNDARRFRVHYEEGSSSRHTGGYRGGEENQLDYGDHRESLPDQKRPRTRSRSPVNKNHRGRDNRSDRPMSTRGGAYGHNGGGNVRNDRGERYKPVNAQQSFTATDRGSTATDRPSNSKVEISSAFKQHDASTSVSDKRQRFAETDSTGRPIPAAEEPAPEPPAPVDENEVIEERRRRREAIKAKHSKAPNTPLLVQALQSGITTAASSQAGSATPMSDGSVSPGPPSPATPSWDFAENSPPSFSVTDDAQLANTNAAGPSTPDADEPSAADYDPIMGAEEDRFRNDMHRNREDNAQSANDPAKHLHGDAAIDETIAHKTLKPADDMFASDDEDDMFAPEAPKKTTDADESSGKAVPAVKAKQLDMSLLDNWDDHEGYYKIILGELLDGRYHVQANLGKGMFSSVVRATDSTDDTLKAIKVIRNNETMTKAAVKEMEILERLAEADPEDKKHLIRLERSFMHKGHLCMVFEHLSINLREVLKKFGRDVGINLKAVRSYAQQMFLGLSLMKKCNILHADLKPDNILVNDARNLLKICDLGSAADAGESDITPYLVSRFYRAPEIILGIPYDFAIDTWSIGCTLFELYTGKILFTGRTNNQMLRSIMECRGKFSLKMLKKAEFGAVHFDDHNLEFRSMERDKVTGKEVTRLMNFIKPTKDLKSRLLATAGSAGGKLIPEADLKELNLFADLLERCLALNPEKRLTPIEALKHPFIYRGPSNGGLMQPTKR